MRRSPMIRRIFLILFLGILAGGAYLLIRLHTHNGLAWAGEAVGVAASVITVITFAGPGIGHWWSGPRVVSSADVREAADDLAMSLRRQWEGEDAERRINDPWPLPVRWKVTAAAAEAMQGVSPGSPGDGAKSFDLSTLTGDFGDVLQTFGRVPSRRLVVLGAAGAGKSVLAMKLAHELLTHRENGDRVPVILPATTWEPHQELSGWIAAQLVRDYPSLSHRAKGAGGGTGSVADALAAVSVMPIIDGLDELPGHLRHTLLVQINKAGSNVPLVLTSRPQEYTGSVASAGRPISRAAVVELLPLHAAEVREYLSEATSSLPPGRWNKVFAALDADPPGELTAVLSTPLMLWLARTVYEDSAADPSVLADSQRFPGRAAIENHLLDAFLPAIYPDHRSKISKYRWTARQARRWLSYLAMLTNRQLGRDLEWWRFSSGVRGLGVVTAAVRGGLLAAATWGAVVWVLWRHGEWRHGSYARHISLHSVFLSGPAGRAIWHNINRFVGSLDLPNLVRFLRGLGAMLSWHSLPVFAVKAAIVATILLFFLSALSSAKGTVPDAIRSKIGIASLARWTISGAVVLGVVLLLVLWWLKSVALALAVIAYLGIAGFGTLLVKRADISAAISPVQALHRDRAATALDMLFGGAAAVVFCWLCGGRDVAVAAAMLAAAELACGLLLGRMNSPRHASSSFTDARIALACTGSMPWRMMAFLADARRRGALRQVGAAYQFRHIRLADRLAAQGVSRLPRLGLLLSDAMERWTVVDRLLRDSPSAAPRRERAWAYRFRESAAEFAAGIELGTPAGAVYHAGPGVAQQYSGSGASPGWVLCALPSEQPVLVARPVWDALRAVAGGSPGADAYAATGLPVTDDPMGPQRAVPADAERVRLAGGSWGPGMLTREKTGSWHWAPDVQLLSTTHKTVSDSKFGWNRRLMHLKAEVTMPYSKSGWLITRQAREEISAKLAAGELARAVSALPEHRGAHLPPVQWQPFWSPGPLHQFGRQHIVTGPRGNVALSVAVKLIYDTLSLPGAPRVRAGVRLDIFAAWGDALETAGSTALDWGQLRLSASELLDILLAAWDTAADVMLAQVVSMSTGSTTVELTVSAPHPAVQRRVGRAGPTAPAAPHGTGSRYAIEATTRLGSALAVSRADRTEHIRAALADMASHLGFSVPDGWQRQT